MKRVAILGLALLTGVVLFSACAGKKDGPLGHGDLASGTYVVSDAQSVSDGCAANSILANGDSFPIVRSSTSDAVVLGGIAGTIVDGVIQDAIAISVYDWNGMSGLDCQETDTYEIEGATTSSNAADIVFRQKWEYLSGSECPQAYQQYSNAVGQTVTLPCSSALRMHIERSGP